MSVGQHKAKIDFKAKQQEFAAFIRNPDRNPAPDDVAPERMSMYRELFFNNVESFLSSNFPVLKSLLSEENWLALARDFYSEHRSSTPYFSEIPEEFLDYLQNERHCSDDLPFMLELAHYEWVEMALAIAKEDTPATIASEMNLRPLPLFLSPLAWLLAYRFPVHQISTDFIPYEAPEQPSFLIVYRTPDDNVKFMQITPSTYRLLEFVQNNPGITAESCLTQLAGELQASDTQLIIDQGLKTLCELADKSIIYSD
ncbi:MAG: DUF2063 domain-containing protein [Gammaproteobacteria bacterium HGW-Gammaproteobacteria-10]|nr:MAG: DUF2063 domain-containing protein [Gammaproteobacteria bacterium HGW-Gammaproteobacteria-10]